MQFFSRMILFTFLISTFSFSQWQKITDQLAGAETKIHVYKDVVFLYDDDMLRSKDSGQTWEDIYSFYPGEEIYSIFTHDDSLFCTGEYSLYTSSDTGKTWQLRSLVGEGKPLLKGYFSDGNKLILRSWYDKIYTSEDNGKTFSEMTVPIYQAQNLVDFDIANQVWIATMSSAGTLYSLDGGLNWKEKNPSGTTVWKTHSHQGYIFGMTYAGGLFRFNTVTETWDQLSAGLEGEGKLRNWMGMTSVGKRVFIKGTYFLSNVNEIYYSDDGGDNWVALDLTDLPDVNYNDAECGIFADADFLYTYNYKRSTTEKTGLFAFPGITTSLNKEVSISLADNFKLYGNYPNPFNPITTITFNLERTQHIVLEIYDIQGEKITTLLDRPKSAGYHKVVFNAGSLSSGTYVYRLKTKKYQLSKRMLLIK